MRDKLPGLITGLALVAGIVAASPARALCYYDGKFSVTTTIDQEFHDALWVVRARVLSAHYDSSDEGNWTSYRLRVIRSYKGRMPARFTFFTMRNSGGFYMDKGPNVLDRADYLLFLVRYPRSSENPPVARGAYWVNYNCGRSQAWRRLTPGQIHRLNALAARR